MKHTYFKRFTTNWNKEGIKDRCVKLVLDLDSTTSLELNNYLLSYYKCLNWSSNKLFEILNTNINPYYIISKGKNKSNLGYIDLYTKNAKIPANSFVQIYKQELTNLGLITSNTRECIAISICNRYVSYIQRNKERKFTLPKRPLGFNNEKGTYIHKLSFNPKTKSIGIPLHGFNHSTTKNKNNILNIPCHTIYNQQYPTNKSISGNLVQFNNSSIFVARSVLPITWLYSPIQPLAVDINLKQSNFLVFSDGLKIVRNNDIEKLCKILKELNKRVRKDDPANISIKSKQRRKLRIKIKKIKRKIKRLMIAIVNPIINKAINEKLLLCIDPSNTGAKNGDYGQTEFISLMIQSCEDKGIPFIVVPTPFTTQRCSICGKQHINIQKTRQKNPNMSCECGNDLDIDINAAKNIAYFGMIIWKYGYEDFQKWLKAQNFISKKA